MADEMLRIAGRGDDGTAKAVKTDNNGNIGVVPVKRSVDVIDLASSISLRDTNPLYYLVDVSAYRDFEFYITSTLDQDMYIGAIDKDNFEPFNFSTDEGVRVRYSPFISDANHRAHKVEKLMAKQYKQPLSTIPMNKTDVTDMEIFKRIKLNFRLAVKCETAPTIGTFSIKFVGVPL